MDIITIETKFQIVIPQRIRRQTGVDMGDLLAGFLQVAKVKISSGTDNHFPFALCHLPFAILFGFPQTADPRAGTALPT
jgi:hypothetical protein